MGYNYRVSSSIEQELLKAKKDARYTAYVCIFALIVNGLLFYLDFEESNFIKNISYIFGFVFLGILIYFSWVKSSRFASVIVAILFFVLSLALIIMFFLATSGVETEVDYSKFAKPILIQLFWIIILGFGLYKGVKGSFRYHSIKQLINK